VLHRHVVALGVQRALRAQKPHFVVQYRCKVRPRSIVVICLFSRWFAGHRYSFNPGADA
jgi:hypothetical protein